MKLSKNSLDFCDCIEKHLQNSGAIYRFLAHIVFVGLPGSGKSTLIARLLNHKNKLEKMLEECESTGIMDGIITVDIAEDKASMHAAASIGKSYDWKQVKFELSCLRQMGEGSFVIKQATAEDQLGASLADSSSESPPKSSRKSKNQQDKKWKSPVEEKAEKLIARPPATDVMANV